MSVANAYAKALYEAAAEAKSNSELSGFCKEIERQLASVAQLLNSSKETAVALISPITTGKEKAALTQEISRKLNLSELLTRFLVLLANKDRFSLIGEISKAFDNIRLLAEGGLAGTLVSAEPMGETDIATLTQAFSRKFGKQVAFRVSTDSSLLAGMKVTVNGVTYDGTLRSQLQRLRDQITIGLAERS